MEKFEVVYRLSEFMLPDIVRNLDGECCNKKSQFYGKAVVEGTTCDFFEEG